MRTAKDSECGLMCALPFAIELVCRYTVLYVSPYFVTS